MTDTEEKIKPRHVAVIPQLIGPANCQAALGDNWRHAKSNALALGVRVLRIGKKDFFRADEYLAALEREQRAEPATPSTAPVDPAEAVRSILRRAGGQ